MALIRNLGLETGDLTGFFWNQNQPMAVTAPHPVREGSYSMRCYCHRYDSTYSYRTEAWVSDDPDNPPDTGGPFYWVIGNEYWLGFSIYIPSGWVDDYEEMTDNILSIQATPDAGEEYRSAVLGLRIQVNYWYVYSAWDPTAYHPGSGHEGQAITPFGPMNKGAWNDFVFHIKWSYGSGGFLQTWWNGNKVVDRTGPNCSNDAKGPRFAIGVYKWGWRPKFNPPLASKTDSRLLYVDSIRVGDSDSSYEEVAPGGAPANSARAARVSWAEVDVPSVAGGSASRFYFPADAQSPVSPAFEGGWNYTAEASRRLLVNTKGTSAITIGSRIGPWLSTDYMTALDRQYISEPLEAQTIDGTVKMQLMTREYAATNNVSRIVLCIKVVSNDGTILRGTLLSRGAYASSGEYINNVTHRNKTGADGDALTAVNALGGDRLVVEIGHRNGTGTVEAPEASAKWGENADDLPEDEIQTADGAGWIDFSSPISFQGLTTSYAYQGGLSVSPLASPVVTQLVKNYTGVNRIAPTMNCEVVSSATGGPFAAKRAKFLSDAWMRRKN